MTKVPLAGLVTAAEFASKDLQLPEYLTQLDIDRDVLPNRALSAASVLLASIFDCKYVKCAALIFPMRRVVSSVGRAPGF